MTSPSRPFGRDIDQRRLDGRYRLIDRMGNGGTAEIWRAHDDRLSRQVAVKILDPTKADPVGVREEAQALARFSHPHIASVYDYGEDGSPYLVMELVEGPTLKTALSRDDIAWPAALACCAQIAAALAAAHRRGLVHRDVTPANIMLTPSGAKLIDFGISAMVGRLEADADGHVRGTPAYVAPERLPERAVTAAADVYSFGLVLYQSLSGRLPWLATTARELWAMRMTNPPDPLPAIEGLPGEVGEICLRCLADDPADRPDAARLADVLGALAPAGAAADLARLAAAVADPTEPTRLLATRVSTLGSSFRRSARVKRLAVVGAACVALGLLGWSLTGWGPVDMTPTPRWMAFPALALPVVPVTPTCAATYELESNDGQQFRAAITATEHSQRLPDGWQLSLLLPGTQPIDVDPASGWQRVAGALTSPAQPALDIGGSAQLTLSGRHTGTLPLPTTLHVDGQECDVTLLASSASTVVTPEKMTSGGNERKNNKKRSGENGKGKNNDD